jgi:hypothetical protein
MEARAKAVGLIAERLALVFIATGAGTLRLDLAPRMRTPDEQATRYPAAS